MAILERAKGEIG